MVDIETLLAENKKLSEEVSLLRAENAALKERLGISSLQEENATAEELQLVTSGINKHSLPEEKIALFRSLFAGRTDVFARRWYGVTSGKSGYQPVCDNEWDEALCDKKKYKCADCPNRKLLPLTDQDIYAHLEGKDRYARGWWRWTSIPAPCTGITANGSVGRSRTAAD